MKLPFYITACLIGLFLTTQSFAQNAEELFEKGEFLKSNNRFEEAVGMFKKAAEIQPDNHLIPFEMAACYTGLTDFKKAVLSLEKAVEIKSDFHEAYELLGDLYANQFRNPQKAAENYDLAFQYDENVENKLRYKLEIIGILYEYDKHHMALKHIKDAEAILPDNFDLQFYEAQYYIETEAYDKAKEIMEKLLTQDGGIPEKSGNEVYFYEMGRIHFYQGNYDKAKEFFQKANDGPFRSKIPIYTPEFFLSVAQVYYGVYEYVKSEEVLKVVLDMTTGSTPTDALDLQKQLLNVKTSKRKLIEAEKSAIEQEKDPDRLADRYSELALYAYQDGDHVQAELACQEYLKLRPLEYNMMFLQAMSMSKLDRTEEASMLLSRMRKNPKVPRPFMVRLSFGLGLVYKNAGRLDEAEEAFKDAYAGPTKEAARYELMEIFKIRRRQEQVDTEK